MLVPKKALGQHWLFNEAALYSVLNAGEVSKADTVLEIGPGLGSLTELLVEKAGRVIAIEADAELVTSLQHNLAANNLKIIHADILGYDLTQLPSPYKVVANIPYYLTSNLIRQLLESVNPPTLMSLLVQKEVAERITATPGQMSVLSFSVQYYAEATMLQTIPKELFEPPPKVDSAVLQIKLRPQPYFKADPKKLFRLIKAGFGERRKQLRNSLAGGLQTTPLRAEELLNNATISPQVRAQELTLDDWQRLYETVYPVE